MKVLIVEDEKLAAERLEELLIEIDSSIHIVQKLESVKDSIDWLSNNTVDLIFLDIRLSDGISFSIFENLRIVTPIIFTTAYDEYAIKAFNLNSIAYLLKPIRKLDLIKSLEKLKSLKSAFKVENDQVLNLINNLKTDYKKRFLVQVGDRFKKMETTQIAYFYAFGKGIYAMNFDGEKYLIETSLDTLEKEIDPNSFYRINRKFIINIGSITKMIAWTRGRIKLELRPDASNISETIVSIERSQGFKEWMNK